MQVRRDVQLATMTTLRLGGPTPTLIEAESTGELVEAVDEADAGGTPPLLIAGGSNLVIADDGWRGPAVAVRSLGIERDEGPDATRLRVAAGEHWDQLVADCVDDGLCGIEALSGIPGSTGATPIQNVGAYGQEVADTILSVRAYDRGAREHVELTPEQCGFGYRTSSFKGSHRFLVLEVVFELERSGRSRPLAYAQLAESLGVGVGESAPLAEVREAVLALRRSKGMVIDPADPDSVSAGSFFTNPILTPGEFEAMRSRAAERLGAAQTPPSWPEPDGRIKTSAAWLLQRAGYGPGYGEGRAGVSSKHSLALVNRGGATAAELIGLARELRDGVESAFGVELVPEPTLVGVEL